VKTVPVTQAAGQVLGHDITQILPGRYKDARFRKGHVVVPEDIPVLLSMGKENLYVLEELPGMVHENDAAETLKTLCMNRYMHASEVKEGKIELFSDVAGFFRFNRETLKALNSHPDITVACRNGGVPVRPGDKLAGMRVIPLMVRQEVLDRAEALTGGVPLLEVVPFRKKTCALVITGSEILQGQIEDAFSPVLASRLGEYGVRVTSAVKSGDDRSEIARLIRKAAAGGADMIFCTGGMSVDPDDRTPGGIRDSGAEIVGYGVPVFPGAMCLVSYLEGIPVLGLPGSVMHYQRTILDLLLPLLLAEIPVTRDFLASLGDGGLCLHCEPCTFPVCGFGKGAGWSCPS